jgi:hypothetical protein
MEEIPQHPWKTCSFRVDSGRHPSAGRIMSAITEVLIDVCRHRIDDPPTLGQHVFHPLHTMLNSLP